MGANQFILELKDLRSAFLFDVKAKMARVNSNTFAVDICDGYLNMRVDGTDVKGNKLSASVKITHVPNDRTDYQRSIRISKIEWEGLS